MLFISLGFSIFAIPLAVTAFILGIVVVAKGRTGAGVVLVLCSMIVPSILLVAHVALSVGGAANKATADSVLAATSCGIENIAEETGHDFVTVTGRVRNNARRAISAIKVTVEYLDRNGKILDTDSTYAVAFEALKPGAAKSFQIMTRIPDGFAKYRYWVESARFTDD